MNVLVVSSYLPYPLHSGGEVRLYNLLKRLSKKHTITLVCEKRPHQSSEDVQEVEKFCREIITFPRKKQWTLQNIFKSGYTPNSFLTTGHTLPEMRNKIKNLLVEGSFDVIHVETSYVLQNVPVTNIPVVLTEHNVEYLVYERYANHAPIFLQPFLRVDIKKLRKEEEAFWKRVTTVVAVSEAEKEIIQRTGVKVSIVPNGVDTTVFKQKNLGNVFKDRDKKFLYIGNYKWIQNKNALRWILTDIWPEIEKRTDSSVKLWIVGSNLPDTFREFASKRVIIQGVSDRPTVEIFSEAFALLSPLKIAGGTQYKILESMAVGTPVITTSLGVEGLQIDNKKTILIADTVEEIVDQAANLLKSETLYKELSKKSREFVEKYFDFDSIAERLDRVYQQVARTHENT